MPHPSCFSQLQSRTVSRWERYIVCSVSTKLRWFLLEVVSWPLAHLPSALTLWLSLPRTLWTTVCWAKFRVTALISIAAWLLFEKTNCFSEIPLSVHCEFGRTLNKSNTCTRWHERFIGAQKRGLAALKERVRILRRPPRWSRSDAGLAKFDWWRWPVWFGKRKDACTFKQTTRKDVIYTPNLETTSC